MARRFNKLIFILLFSFLLIPFFVFAIDASDLPPGRPIDLSTIKGWIDTIARFLIRVAIVVAVITIIWAGVLWTTAGSSERKQNAKDWLRNGVIGALVILGVGVILQTGFALVTGDFFSGGGGGPGGTPGGGTGAGTIGWACRGNSDCQSGLVCNKNGICARQTGNKEGEKCTNNSDCASGLVCQKPTGEPSLGTYCQKPSSGQQVRTVGLGFPCDGRVIVCEQGLTCKPNPASRNILDRNTCQR